MAKMGGAGANSLPRRDSALAVSVGGDSLISNADMGRANELGNRRNRGYTSKAVTA